MLLHYSLEHHIYSLCCKHKHELLLNNTGHKQQIVSFSFLIFMKTFFFAFFVDGGQILEREGRSWWWSFERGIN